MLLALIVLVWIMLAVAKRYKRGEGVTSAPKGLQNAIETVVNFVRDEVAKPNLGHKYQKYLPFLTIFFFILINNIFGLIPGSANVTGNIAFTLVLVADFFCGDHVQYQQALLGTYFLSSGIHMGVKFILVPVNFLVCSLNPLR